MKNLYILAATLSLSCLTLEEERRRHCYKTDSCLEDTVAKSNTLAVYYLNQNEKQQIIITDRTTNSRYTFMRSGKDEKLKLEEISRLTVPDD